MGSNPTAIAQEATNVRNIAPMPESSNDPRIGARPGSSDSLSSAPVAELIDVVTSLLAQATEPDLDLDEVMKVVCAHAQYITDAAGAVVEMADGEFMVYRAATGCLEPHVGLRLKRVGSLSGLTIASKEVAIAADTESDPRVDREACRKVGARSMLLVPLWFAGAPVGVLKVISPKASAFAGDHVQSLHLLAGVIAVAIRRAADREQQLATERSRAMGERLWRSVVEQSLSGFYIVQNLRFTYANRRFLEMLGYTLEELLALPSALEIIRPDQRALATENVRIRESGERETVHYELDCLRRDGTPIILEIFGGSIELESGTAVIATVIDITDRRRSEDMLRESEEWFRTLVESSTDMFGVLTLEGVYTYCSPSVFDQLGYEPGELVGRSAFDFIHHDDMQRIRRELDHALATPPHRASLALRFRHKSGSWRDCDTQVRIVSDPNGTPLLVVATRDVTEAHRLQRQMGDAERLVALGRVASAMAHEFNNVLMGIQPNAELIKRFRDEQKIRAAAERIEAGVRRGKTITQQVLRFTRSEPPSRRVVAVADILRAVQLEIAPVLPRGVSLAVEQEGELFVLADASQIEQTLVNLCLNARDAMPKGGAIAITSAASNAQEYPYGVLPATSAGFVRLSVQDSGTGVAPELRERIFEPLFTTKKGEGGSGLGLSVAQHIATVHEGALFLETEPGEGSTFHLFLVRAEPTVAAPVRRAGQSLLAKRVLIVEDDDMVAHGLEMAIGEWCEATHRVSTGGAAAAAAMRFTPDIVLLDYGLPDMRGTAVYRQLRANHPALPVVFITGHADGEIVRDEIGSSRVYICHKPFEIAELLDVMREAVEAGARP